MSHVARRSMAFVVAICSLLLLVEEARAAQPLRPQIARCIPKIGVPADATKGAGNLPSSRKIDVEFRWALGDVNDSPADAIAATTRVEVCWTSAAKNGIAQCPGQAGDDAWIIYRASPAKGSLPAASDVQDPTKNLSVPGVKLTLPLDWDSIADRNKILFIAVNTTVKDGADLLVAQNGNLTAGGVCGTPTRIEPGSPGTATAPAEHFVVYGTPSDFSLPAGWLLKYPAVCSPDAVAACPASDCPYKLHDPIDPKKKAFGPCITKPSVSFWRGMMDRASDWQELNVQGNILKQNRLIPWTNGTAAPGSTCSTGNPCPTRSLWIPWDGAGTGGEGYGVSVIEANVFAEDKVFPLSDDSGYVLRNIGHEYFHTFGAKWGRQATDLSGYDAYSTLFADPLVAESLPELTGMTMCFTQYPGNPNGDKLAPDKCVSSKTLYGFDSWVFVDDYVEFPGGNQNFLEPYVGFWFWRYAAEQLAVPAQG